MTTLRSRTPSDIPPPSPAVTIIIRDVRDAYPREYLYILFNAMVDHRTFSHIHAGILSSFDLPFAHPPITQDNPASQVSVDDNIKSWQRFPGKQQTQYKILMVPSPRSSRP
jgi:hypothetical protein